jgi:drug/metabolite transporter (DMT)-like permease
MGTLLVPVFGVVASSVILGERYSTVDIVAFALILLAALISLTVRPPRAAAGA